MRRSYTMKKTISIKQFIGELGKDFSEHTKERLLELEVPCVLTRKEDVNKLDLKHVEHTQYACTDAPKDSSKALKKEFSYGQFIVVDGELFYSQTSDEIDSVMQSPIIQTIYNSLNGENIMLDSTDNAKRIDDSNIDHVVNSILNVCPEVSPSYLSIMSKYM